MPPGRSRCSRRSPSSSSGPSPSPASTSTRDLQLEDRQSWFSDLGVSYHVGFFGWSLWLAGLTIVVSTAAIAYALWADRERARAYHGLLLFLMGAIAGVFASQDLLLFYVFFEAMLIPLYVLIGVWGGPRRARATATFVIYTMAGSLLMLASIVVFGLSQGTFDLVESGTSTNDWVFLGFLAAFAVKAPLFPFHGWLVDAYRESPPELAAILSGRRLEGGGLRASCGSRSRSSRSRSTTCRC